MCDNYLNVIFKALEKDLDGFENFLKENEKFLYFWNPEHNGDLILDYNYGISMYNHESERLSKEVPYLLDISTLFGRYYIYEIELTDDYLGVSMLVVDANEIDSLPESAKSIESREVDGIVEIIKRYCSFVV